MRRIGVIAGLAATVTALAVLVDSGRLAALDRFARSHLSPLQAGPAGRGGGEPLQLIGIHPLSDVVAGALAGAALWLAVESLSRRLPPRSVAAPRSVAPAAPQPASG